eukprot:12407550-Karenia_brevis.AAC.1
MDIAYLEKIANILNQWWVDPDTIPPHATNAIVALVYKAIIQHRIALTTDGKLQPTHYGFRKHKGTREAPHNIRRLVTFGE